MRSMLHHMVAITRSQELTFDSQLVNSLTTQHNITRNLLQLTSFAVWREQVLLYVATAGVCEMQIFQINVLNNGKLRI